MLTHHPRILPGLADVVREETLSICREAQIVELAARQALCAAQPGKGRPK